jgi:hypothetical protein
MSARRLLAVLALLAPASSTEAERITVVREAAAVVLRTSAAEFRLLPSAELTGALLVGGRRLSLQEAEGPGDAAEVSGAPAGALVLDLGLAVVSDVEGSLGRGKRVEATGEGAHALRKTLVVEAYDDFPNLALSTVTYRNDGTRPLVLTRVVQQAHRLNASLADPRVAPSEMWSFHGASAEWGEDETLPLAKGFARANVLGTQLPNGLGGGVPVVAFWTAAVGTAIGHLEALPQVASLPVSVGMDGRISISLVVEPRRTLAPGETYAAPRSFLAVFAGDFYEPLRLYSLARQREGWPIARPSGAAYEPAWCGWGYEFDVTPAEMLGTIPKLKELGIGWATLDDRWFAGYGDWLPRPDTFPGDSIRTMVEGFHREGIKVQIWWLPLAVEDGEGKYASHAYALSDVVARHPEWLILDEKGGFYNEVQLSRGTFRNLYVHGYDVPEGYAIAKDGRMHYAFFTRDPAVSWKGRVELRGLERGRYTVHDSISGADLGAIDASRPSLSVSFTGHLFLEAVPVP